MIYIFSNIKASPIKANELSTSIRERDTLVFLNKAINFELFQNTPASKFLICAVKEDANGKLVKAIEDGRIEGITVEQRQQAYFTRPEWYGREASLFDTFILRTSIEKQLNLYYPKDKTPTTGFLTYQYFKKENEVVLVSFFPNKDFSTTHWNGHDFRYEQDVLDWDGVKVLDLR